MKYLKNIFFIIAFLSSATTHAEEEKKESGIGKVTVAHGEIYQQKGEIYFSRPAVGEKVKVNAFGQYRDELPTAAYINWAAEPRTTIAPGNALLEGTILQTMTDGRTKLLMMDDSVLELGPNTVLGIEYYKVGLENKVYLKLMLGRLHVVANRKIKTAPEYQIATPDSLLGVRGTEFFVLVKSLKKSFTSTEVICTHGQVSVDVAKYNKKGLLYYYPYVVNPGSQFINQGVRGLSQESSLVALPSSEVRQRISEISPGVNTWSSGTIRSDNDNQLPGTGISFNKEDFKMPDDFEVGKKVVEGKLQRLPYLGPLPVDFLPGNNSRVQISIGN